MAIWMMYQAMGSPAHAGIDPLPTPAGGLAKRFPRTRGDRPIGALVQAAAAGVPPHTRG